jgi:predicted nucleic acid-binding protein
MILIDSSVWIDHLRRADVRLQEILGARRALTHSFVIGELAMGHLRPRKEVLSLMQNLPHAVLASDREVLGFIERHSLHGLGIGYVDAHLLASARLTTVFLWTHDKRLHEAAGKLGLAHRQNR